MCVRFDACHRHHECKHGLLKKGTTLSWRRLTERDVFVQRGLEVPGKTMKYCVTIDGESEALISVVVHV